MASNVPCVFLLSLNVRQLSCRKRRFSVLSGATSLESKDAMEHGCKHLWHYVIYLHSGKLRSFLCKGKMKINSSSTLLFGGNDYYYLFTSAKGVRSGSWITAGSARNRQMTLYKYSWLAGACKSSSAGMQTIQVMNIHDVYDADSALWVWLSPQWFSPMQSPLATYPYRKRRIGSPYLWIFIHVYGTVQCASCRFIHGRCFRQMFWFFHNTEEFL